MATRTTTRKPLRVSKPIRDLLALNAQADEAWQAWSTARKGHIDNPCTPEEKRLWKRWERLDKPLKARARAMVDRIEAQGWGSCDDLPTLAVLAWFDARAKTHLAIAVARSCGLLGDGFKLAVPQAI